MNRKAVPREIFAKLDAAYDYGGWHWQPDTSPEFISISAVLVQHTNWSNVERALARLEAAGACSLGAILKLREEELAELVRPAGMALTKARRLLALAGLADEHGGLPRLLALPVDELRPRLLGTKGIGPETADAIVLYAAGRAVFQVDAYAIRLFRRLGLGPESDGYAAWQAWFEEAVPRDAGAFQRYHGLIVLHGKERCRPRPRCAGCCLLEMCPTGQEREAKPARGGRSGGGGPRP